MEAFKENQDPLKSAPEKAEDVASATMESLKKEPMKETPEEDPEEEEKLSPAEQKLQDKIKALLAEYYLTPFQMVAC